MLTFLTPLALAGLALLSIPVLIHLFKPRKVRQTPFSSLRFLHLTQQKLARRIKWHQVLLFLLRAAFIVFVVLALAKPMFAPGDSGGFAERFIVLDVSRSMAYQTAGRPTPIELGKQVAAKLVEESIPGDRTAVLLTGSTTRSLGPLRGDSHTYLPMLQGVKATASDTDLTSALQVIRPMLARQREGSRVQLYFITDNHQQGWRQGDVASFLKELDAPVEARVIDVGIAAPQNVWVASAKLIESNDPASGAVTRRAIRVQVGAVGDAPQDRNVRLTGLAGQPERTATVKVEPGQVAQVELELPPDYDLDDKVARIAIDPADSLPSDDELFLNLGAGASTRVLLVEGDSTQIAQLRPGFYLRVALEALSAQSPGTIRLNAKTAATAERADVENADVIVLAGVAELPDAIVAAMETRVKAGAGAAIFLGPDLEPAFYNEKLHKPLAPSDSLMPAPLRDVRDVQSAGAGELAPIAHVQWSHPMLAPLFDPVLGDLQRTRFTSYYQFDTSGGDASLGGAHVLARVGELAPAILERDLGAGKVLVFNTSPNDAWSDLPRRKSFVPLIDRVLNYLTGGNVRRTFEVGDAVALPVAGAQPGETVNVTTPGGQTISATLHAAGSRAMLRLDSVQELGVYRVDRATASGGGGGGEGFAFVVQAGRGDSVLAQADPATLNQWWNPNGITIVSPESVLSGAADAGSDRRVALWPWFVALACLMLVAEMFFVHWLCPKMNPSVTAQTQRRTLVASTTLEKQTT